MSGEQQAETKKGAKPKFFNPPNRLKQKVGDGGIAANTLKKGQDYLDANKIDFEPYAKDFLKALKTFVEKAEKSPDNQELTDSMIKPIMELKANGSMFQYHLVSMIADVVLQFLETVQTLNKDVLEILKVHNKTLEIIIQNKIKGPCGKEGELLTQELYEACKRYYKKHNIS